VSPDHALLIDGVLIHASALVNGTTILRESRVPETFVYHHVELADHALILAEGVAAETFVDNIDRMAFDNWAERGDEAEAIAEMDYPRAQSARQVPAAPLLVNSLPRAVPVPEMTAQMRASLQPTSAFFGSSV